METNPKKQRQHFDRDYASGQWSMSELCDRYQISRPIGYKWVDRIEPCMLVAITSRRATIRAVVKDSKDLRPGVISMIHGYGIDLERVDAGADPGEPQSPSMGNHTGALASAEFDYEAPYTGIPRMSSIPVRVRIRPCAGDAEGIR